MANPAPARLTPEAIRRGSIAVLCTWLIPGAGHLLLKARSRAIAFCLLVLCTVGLGVAFDGNLAVVDPATPWLSRLEVAADLSIGPWESLLRTSLYGSPVYSKPFSPENNEARDAALKARKDRAFKTWSSYGSIYLLAAGLMNILVMLDAWDIAIGRKE